MFLEAPFAAVLSLHCRRKAGKMHRGQVGAISVRCKSKDESMDEDSEKSQDLVMW